MMRGKLRYKVWMRRLLLYVTLCLALVAGTVFVIDPLQHYRRATFYRPLWENQRYYNPGFAKHYDYNCIITGSSMVQSFTPSEVGKKLSRRVLLTSIGGGRPYEENILLNTALRTGKVRTVIWGLDLNEFGGGTKVLNFGPGSMPFYLYDDNPFNDYHYLLNLDVLVSDCRRALAANLLHLTRYNREMNLDSCQYVADRFTFSRETTLATWRDALRQNAGPVQVRPGDLDTMKRCFDVNVMPLIGRHPAVEYYFFYPPYSVLFWSVSGHRLETLMDLKRYIFQRTRGLPNVRIFDFQDIGDITMDLDNYMDYSHYSPAICRFMVDAMSRNEYVVTDSNVEQKISRLESEVQKFDDSLAAARSDSSRAPLDSSRTLHSIH
ncbi:MAG TPA: hypothetical protein VMH22_13795 [bacterium]|nr:hypothetical protein [bacterium]